MSTRNWPSVIPTPVNQDNALASLTIPASGDFKRAELVNVVVGYSAKPTTAKLLTVKKGSTVICQVPITEAGPAPINLEGFMSGPNQALTIELAASGTAGIIGYVNASARYI